MENKFYNLYLFFGEEDFLIDFYVKKLKDKFIKSDDKFNYFFVDENNFDEEKIINNLLSYPFLSDYKLIYIYFNGALEKISGVLEKNFKNIPVSNILLIRDNAVDKRKKSYKFIENNGQILYYEKLSDEKLIKWIIKKFKESNINISMVEAGYILAKVGNDMYTLSNEISKIKASVLDKDGVTKDDIDKIISYRAFDRVFELIDHISNRDADKAMEAYNDLLSLNEPPMKILALIFRNYNILYQIKEVDNINNKEIISKIGIPVFFAKKYKSISNKFSLEELRDIINELYDIDYNIKTGNIKDRTSLELFISKQCKGKK